jgi:hypothetical protein
MSYKDDLDKATFALRDQVGRVLSSGATIMGLRARAAQFQQVQDSKIVSQAVAVVAKANGLLANYKSIESDSLAALGQANGLLAEMSADPNWRALLVGIDGQPLNLSVLGSAGKAMFSGLAGKAVSLIQQLAAITQRSNNHLAAVRGLSSDVSRLEDAAQGKGWHLPDIAGAAATRATTIFSLAALGVAAFYILPLLPKARRSS